MRLFDRYVWNSISDWDKVFFDKGKTEEVIRDSREEVFDGMKLEIVNMPQGLVFPVSSGLLDRIDGYRSTLQNHSTPRMPFIDWRPTPSLRDSREKSR